MNQDLQNSRSRNLMRENWKLQDKPQNQKSASTGISGIMIIMEEN